jgi:alpha-mannosidase
MTSLILKSNQWEVLESAGNVVARQYDGGDLWELYQNLNGGSNIAMKRQQQVPEESKDQFSTEYRGEKGSIHCGPVFSEFRVAHNFGIDNTFSTNIQGTFATRVRLYTGMRRIDIRTQIMNNEKYVRYQVLFPTTIQNGKINHEIPFGSIERPLAIEFPTQNWADYSDGKKGLSLLNRGIPGNLTSESTMMLSLMRSATLMSYGSHRFNKDIEPWMTSIAGLELGKELTFDYALVPHEGDWRQGEVFRHGQEFNNPLICIKAESHEGKLPKSWGLLKMSHPNVIITALKPGSEGTTVLRLYEATGKATAGVTIKFQTIIMSANEANLMEDIGREVKVEHDILRFDLGAFEIKTFKLRLKPAKAD